MTPDVVYVGSLYDMCAKGIVPQCRCVGVRRLKPSYNMWYEVTKKSKFTRKSSVARCVLSLPGAYSLAVFMAHAKR